MNENKNSQKEKKTDDKKKCFIIMPITTPELLISEYSGVRDFIFHNLRHTASTIMVSEALGRGVGLADVMRILGHSQISTTMRYLHPDFSRMKKAMQVLEKKTKKKE